MYFKKILAYIHIIIGPLLEGEWESWPIYRKVDYGDCTTFGNHERQLIVHGKDANLYSNHANWFASFKIMVD